MIIILLIRLIVWRKRSDAKSDRLKEIVSFVIGPLKGNMVQYALDRLTSY